MNHRELANQMKKNCLVLDIECYSEADISKDFERYVKTAKVKWIGFYSYKTEKYYEINTVNYDKEKIKAFIAEHDTIITFNGLEFDEPILRNNYMMPEKKLQHIDAQNVLGNDILKHKMRGGLMEYKFKSNSLKNMAIEMKLETQKGDIDYLIFKKNEWTSEEELEIRKYLKSDVEVTKQMFDKLFDFWIVFTEFISERNVRNWSWITSKIAALVYKESCEILNCPEEYGDRGADTDIGGRVIEPRVESAEDVFYIDVTSLYPNMYIMFNLVNEVNPINNPNAWHGNEVFKVKGYYDISKKHILTENLLFKLRERIRLKKEDPNNPLTYAYKIFLNTFYGCNRSKVFKNIHTENSGADCCLLGQQVNKIMEQKAKELGYDTLYGDTDSIFIKHTEKKTKEQVKEDIKKIVDYILKYVPFPVETFDIAIENHLHYVMWVQDEDGKNKKKNYTYIYTDKSGNKKVKIMGLPIKKTNATDLGKLIFTKYIEPRMIEENTGKFDANWINEIIQKEVKENLELMAQEYKPSDFDSYSVSGRGCLTAQISKQYLNGKSGIIKLIKNKKIGKVGSDYKYCTLEEAKNYGLKVSDLDLTKVYNELAPFTKGKADIKTSGFFRDSNSGSSMEMKLKAKGYF